MAERNGNGKWLTIAIGVIAFVGGLGVAWGCQQSAVAQNTKEIAAIKEQAKTDHDMLIAVNAKLAAIESALQRIEDAVAR